MWKDKARQHAPQGPLPAANRQESFESVNARIRKAARARGHFPTEVAALKCVYLAVMSLDPTGLGQRRWVDPPEGGPHRRIPTADSGSIRGPCTGRCGEPANGAMVIEHPNGRRR